MQFQNLALRSFKEHSLSILGESFSFSGNLDWEIGFLKKGFCAIAMQKCIAGFKNFPETPRYLIHNVSKNSISAKYFFGYFLYIYFNFYVKTTP